MPTKALWKNRVLFSKQSGLPKILKFLILVFSDVTWKPRIVWSAGPLSIDFVIFFTSFAASYHQVSAILFLESFSPDDSFLFGSRALKQSWKKVTTHFWEYSRENSCKSKGTTPYWYRSKDAKYYDKGKESGIIYRKANFFIPAVFNIHVYNCYQVARETIKSVHVEIEKVIQIFGHIVA